MRIWKYTLLFVVGGGTYIGLELLWRGWSHYTMFVAGGSAFLLLGQLSKLQPPPILPLRAVIGAGVITLVEYTAGLICNRSYTVWDYRQQPLQLHGQICLGYCLLWIPVAMGAMVLYRWLEGLLTGKNYPEEAPPAFES